MSVSGTIKAIVLLCFFFCLKAAKSQSLADCFFTGATKKQERGCDRIGELRHETH